MLVSKLHSCISSHVSGDLFLISTAVNIVCIVVIGHFIIIRIVGVSFANTLLTDIACTYVWCNKLHVRIHLRLLYDSSCEHISRKHDHVSSICYSLVNTCVTCLIRVALWFIIVELRTILFGPRLTCLVSGLVKALVCNITGVSYHGDLHISSLSLHLCHSVSWCKGKCHCTCKNHSCNSFLHIIFPPFLKLALLSLQ